MTFHIVQFNIDDVTAEINRRLGQQPIPLAPDTAPSLANFNIDDVNLEINRRAAAPQPIAPQRAPSLTSFNIDDVNAEINRRLGRTASQQQVIDELASGARPANPYEASLETRQRQDLSPRGFTDVSTPEAQEAQLLTQQIESDGRIIAEAQAEHGLKESEWTPEQRAAAGRYLERIGRLDEVTASVSTEEGFNISSKAKAEQDTEREASEGEAKFLTEEQKHLEELAAPGEFIRRDEVSIDRLLEGFEESQKAAVAAGPIAASIPGLVQGVERSKGLKRPTAGAEPRDAELGDLGVAGHFAAGVTDSVSAISDGVTSLLTGSEALAKAKEARFQPNRPETDNKFEAAAKIGGELLPHLALYAMGAAAGGTEAAISNLVAKGLNRKAAQGAVGAAEAFGIEFTVTEGDVKTRGKRAAITAASASVLDPVARVLFKGAGNRIKELKQWAKGPTKKQLQSALDLEAKSLAGLDKKAMEAKWRQRFPNEKAPTNLGPSVAKEIGTKPNKAIKTRTIAEEVAEYNKDLRFEERIVLNKLSPAQRAAWEKLPPIEDVTTAEFIALAKDKGALTPSQARKALQNIEKKTSGVALDNRAPGGVFAPGRQGSKKGPFSRSAEQIKDAGKIGNITIKSFEGADDSTLKFLDNVQDIHSEAILKAGRGIVSDKALEKAARDAPLSLEKLSAIPKGTAPNAETLVKAGDVVFGEADRATKMYQKAFDSKDPLDREMAELAGNRAAESWLQFKRLATEAGRALRSRQVVNSKVRGQLSDLNKAMKRIDDGLIGKDSIEEISAHLKISLKEQKFIEKANSVWVSGLLSGIGTQGRNITGNLGAAIFKPLTTVTNAGIEAIAVPLTNAKNRVVRNGLIAKKNVFFGDAWAEAKDSVKGVVQGFEAGVTAFKTGQSSGKFGKATALSDKGSRVFALGKGPKAQASKLGLERKLAKVVDKPPKLLLMMDEGFKGVAFRGEAAKLVHNALKKQKLGYGNLRGNKTQNQLVEEVIDATTKMAKNPEYVPTGPNSDFILDVVKSSRYAAEYQTFTRDLGSWGRATLIKAKNEPVGAGFRPGMWLFPFVKTRANLTKYAIEASPLGYLKLIKAENRANVNAIAKAMAVPTTGTALGAIVAGGVLDGWTSGGRPHPGSDGSTERSVGWKPYAVYFDKNGVPGGDAGGGQWITYDRIEPAGRTIGLIADGLRIYQAEGSDEKLQAAWESFDDNIISQSFVDSIRRNMGENVKGQEQLARFAASAVPAIVNEARNITDQKRDPKGFYEHILNRFPILSESLPRKKDSQGRDIEETTLERLVNTLSPVKLKKIDPELYDRIMELSEWNAKRRRLRQEENRGRRPPVKTPLDRRIAIRERNVKRDVQRLEKRKRQREGRQ